MIIPPSHGKKANSTTLKRTYTAIARSSSDPPAFANPDLAHVNKARYRGDSGQARQTVSRRRGGLHEVSKMSSAAGSRIYEQRISSFQSVYDMMEDPSATSAPPKVTETTAGSLPPQGPQADPHSEHANAQIHVHQHRESTSTQNSDSTDSSPTTTISTVDSSSITDPSPSSSPSSPITTTVVPLSSFSGTTFGLDSFQGLKMADNTPRQTPLQDDRPMTSPGPRKSKNLKSLALNLRQDSEPLSSEPSSPSFIKPPTLGAKKKPSLLSLNTGAANANTLQPLGSARMPTMLQRRGLKHSVSSPQMLITPGFGPQGGMKLGDQGILRLGDSKLGTFTINEDGDNEAPAAVQMATRVPGASVGGDSFDRPATGDEAKSPSYPDGPILMHEPSVHLYMEPKPEEAMRFDVVINVAREVRNPFDAIREQSNQEVTYATRHSRADSNDIPPDTAASIVSFQTAYEVQPPDTERSDTSHSSPSTPRPNQRIPEYIHVPWDHNTDVGDELWDLCQTIDARVKEGKKVLVHCQQGASRSATLIIAYGMYINQDLGPNEAYTQAQAKSRWVNPNMSLLFSLNDFKKVIERKKAEKIAARPYPIKLHRASLSADSIPATPARGRGNSTPQSTTRENPFSRKDEIKPDNGYDAEIERLSKFDFGFSTAPHPIPPPQDNDMDWQCGLMSPRISEMTDNPLQRVFNRAPQPIHTPVPEEPEPPLFSPRVAEFPRSTFFPQASTQHTILPDEDPRSPPMRGEAPITRSIDDFIQ